MKNIVFLQREYFTDWGYEIEFERVTGNKINSNELYGQNIKEIVVLSGADVNDTEYTMSSSVGVIYENGEMYVYSNGKRKKVSNMDEMTDEIFSGFIIE